MELSSNRPIASIQEEREVYIADDGSKRERKDIFAKLFVTFRDKWLGKLSGIELKVWLCLLLHSNADGICWPSLETISKETCYKSVPDISRTIDKLIEYKLIKKEHQGIGKANRYTLLQHKEKISAE